MINSLSDYLVEYGNELAAKVETVFRPLHVPGRDALPPMKFLRNPMPAQAHVIAASVRALKREGQVWVGAKMGAGKSLMSICIADVEAAGNPYRSLVLCPPHLPGKWKREIEITLPNAKATIIKSYRDLLELAKHRPRPTCSEWLIVTTSTAKLGNPWKPSFIKTTRSEIFYCPSCHAELWSNKKDRDGEYLAMTISEMEKSLKECSECGEQLYQWVHQFDRWPVATFVQRKMRGMFRHLVVDEAHQAKGQNTAIAISMSKLASSSRYFIGLTGTVMGGYATDVHGLLWRSAPRTLVASGEKYEDRKEFIARYGRLDRVITEKKNPESNRFSYGEAKTSTTTKERPGVMPSLFADHLLNKVVFLSLDEVAADLPEQIEQVIPSKLDSDIESHYREMELALKDNVREMMQSKSGRAALSRMVHMLLYFPDMPYGWQPVGFYADDDDMWVNVFTPRSFEPRGYRNKEQAIVNRVMQEYAENRQVWIFVQQTQKRDIQARLASLLQGRGLKVEVMRSQTVPTSKREEWIARHGKTADVIISHPGLVETGLDLFDLKNGHNFCTLLWYQQGYSIYTLRQASARALRIGQTQECRVCYHYYISTMQERAMNLMCQKLVASESIEGKFSEGGLASLSDDTESMTIALAKSLAESIDDSAGIRAWERLRQK